MSGKHFEPNNGMFGRWEGETLIPETLGGSPYRAIGQHARHRVADEYRRRVDGIEHPTDAELLASAVVLGLVGPYRQHDLRHAVGERTDHSARSTV